MKRRTLRQGPFDFEPTSTARVRPLDATSRAFRALALANCRRAYSTGN